METLEEVKDYLKRHYEDGCSCPACGQHVQLYKRRLNSGMAATLIRMYQHKKFDWVHVKAFLLENKYRNNHDWTLLRHWGLIEERQGEVHSGRASGEWRVTMKGRDFLEGKITVRRSVHLYNNFVMGWSLVDADIHDALKDDFDYEKLMSIHD